MWNNVNENISIIEDKKVTTLINNSRKAERLGKLNWFLFPFFIFSAAMVIAFYMVDFFIINIWYIRAYFYAFFAAQIWLLAQFYLYVSMKPPPLDFGTRYKDRMPDKVLTVLVSCYNEPAEIIEKTLKSIRETFSGKVILVDDSTVGYDLNRKIALKYRVAHYRRGNRRGFKAGALNDIMRFVRTEYIALLDSDAMPTQSFFDIGLAYARRYEVVQFPQYYYNRNRNTVSKGSYAQQIPFMYRIMPLRSSRNSAFMLGTNLIFNRKSIEDLGGFDEHSVTEDLSTSVKFHEKGNRSIYITRNTVMNMAPESLRSYFIQQKRWSTGTIGVFRSFITDRRRSLKVHRYADYLIGSSWYLYGFVFPLLASSVFIFSIFRISFIFVNALLYYTLYLPFLLLSFGIYYLTIVQTGHGVKELFYNLSFNAVSFPIYAKGVIKGLSGSKYQFERTPKDKSNSDKKYRTILPQLTLLVILLTSMMMSGFDAIDGIQRIPSIFNFIWATFYFSLLAPVYMYPY